MAASLVRDIRSAPTKPGEYFAIVSKSKPSANFVFAVRTFKICIRASKFGIPKQISLSNLPARRSAGSIESGRLVAPITSTWSPDAFSLKSAKKII